MTDVNETVSRLCSTIDDGDNDEIIMCLLETSPKRYIKAFVDVNGFDVLHHAIIANNVVLVNALLSPGLFLPPHLPKFCPYIHLACRLGYKTILQLLLNARPTDNTISHFNISWPDTCPRNYEKISTNSDNIGNGGNETANKDHTPDQVLKGACLDKSPQKKCSNIYLELGSDHIHSNKYTDESESRIVTDGNLISPLEVAAKCSHLNCVLVLLTSTAKMWKNTKLCGNLLYQSVVEDCPDALRLLLWNCAGVRQELNIPQLTFTVDDKQAALTQAILKVDARCIRLLLQSGVDTSGMYNGMNVYHVLYAYNQCFGNSSNVMTNIINVTSIFLKHGLNIHAHIPSCTYPLYSFIHCISCDIEQYYVKDVTILLEMLLMAGADPNFDEVFEYDATKPSAFGRPPYSSALHCLLGNVESSCRYSHLSTLISSVQTWTEILLRHGANPNKVGQLSEFPYEEVSTPLMLSICIAFFSSNTKLWELLMAHGADHNTSQNGRYCFNALWDYVNHQNNIEGQHVYKCLSFVLNYMSYESLKNALRYVSIQKDEDDRTSGSVILGRIHSELLQLQTGVWTLKRLCVLVIRSRCQWNTQKIRQLPLPNILKETMHI